MELQITDYKLQIGTGNTTPTTIMLSLHLSLHVHFYGPFLIPHSFIFIPSLRHPEPCEGSCRVARFSLFPTSPAHVTFPFTFTFTFTFHERKGIIKKRAQCLAELFFYSVPMSSIIFALCCDGSLGERFGVRREIARL